MVTAESTLICFHVIYFKVIHPEMSEGKNNIFAQEYYAKVNSVKNQMKGLR
jgi:hypothetical protein